MDIEFDKNKVTFKELKSSIEKVGYSIKQEIKAKKEVIDEDKLRKEKEIKNLKNKLIIAIVIAIPLFYIAMGPMLPAPFGPLPVPNIIDHTTNSFNYALIQLLLVIPIVGAGYKFYVNGTKAIISKSPNMDSLVMIGTGAALLYSIYTTIQIGTNPMSHNSGTHHQLYYESAGIIITLILLGKYLESK